MFDVLMPEETVNSIWFIYESVLFSRAVITELQRCQSLNRLLVKTDPSSLESSSVRNVITCCTRRRTETTAVLSMPVVTVSTKNLRRTSVSTSTKSLTTWMSCQGLYLKSFTTQLFLKRENIPVQDVVTEKLSSSKGSHEEQRKTWDYIMSVRMASVLTNGLSRLLPSFFSSRDRSWRVKWRKSRRPVSNIQPISSW